MPKGSDAQVKRLAAEVKALKIAKKAVKVVNKAKKAHKSGKSGGFFGSLGKSVGAGVGGFLGTMATKALMSVTGMGDYKVHSNSLYVHSLTSSPPPVFRSDTHSTRMVHREYIGDVSSTTGFGAAYKFSINPNTSIAFPWLGNIAVQFEEYRFHGLIFEFKSTCGSAISSTNNAMGGVIMATNYNCYAPDFSSKVAVDAHDYTVSTRPDLSALHPIECDPKIGGRSSYFVDSSAFSAGGDLRMTNMGNFYLYCYGQQTNNVTIGELWVTYDIELFKPRLQNNAASAAEANSAAYYNSSAGTGGSGPIIYNDCFNYVQLYPDSNSGTLSTQVRPSTSNFVVQFGSVANGYPNTIFFPPDFRGKILFIWTFFVSMGSSTPTNLGANSVIPVSTSNVVLANGLGFNSSTCNPDTTLGSYETCWTTTSAGASTIAKCDMRYIFVCSGTGAIDPITQRSTASVKFAPSTGFPFSGSTGTTSTTWANRFEFYPVFL